MAAAVEVKKRGKGGGFDLIPAGLGFSDLFQCAVESIHVGLVVVLMVYLHDLTRDVWFEGTIVV